METIVTLVEGLYRNQTLNGQFKVASKFRQYSESKRDCSQAKLGYTGIIKLFDYSGEVIRVHTKPEFLSYPAENQEAVEEVNIEALDTMIRKRFNVLDMMSGAVVNGDVRGLIVSGAAGIGKTYKFEKDLNNATDEGDIENLMHIKGKVTPLYLYETLFNNSGENDVVLLDDSDSVFEDETSLNILKAALDSGDTRIVSYGSTCKYLEEHDIPSRFEFKGTIVFITNLDFQGMCERGTRLAPHFKALLSRSHYLTLGVYTPTEIMVRVQQVAKETNLLASRGVADSVTAEMVEWMWAHVETLREVSIRTLLKLADYANMSDWRETAEIMLLK